MKAVVLRAPRHVRVEHVDDPVLEDPTDVILRVTSTAICGSDLHIYNGFLPQTRPMIPGHEFMGVVEEVGRAVERFKPGDRVLVPCVVACGRCFFCSRGLHAHCSVSNAQHYGPGGGLTRHKGGGIFGYTDLYGAHPGGQAEYVRVPFADAGLRRAPAGLLDEQLLCLADTLPAGWTAIARAAPRGGETVAVLGCGPVGIVAMKCAWLRGAARVIGVDREPSRLRAAARLAQAEVVSSESEDVVDHIRSATEGRGADVVVDAVGLEAHRTPLDKLANVVHLQSGSIAALRTAASAVRRGGTISVVGVYATSYDAFPIGQLFEKGVSLRMGYVPVHAVMDELLAEVTAGRIRTDDIVTHRLPLEDAPRGYQLFCSKEDGCLKVVLKP